MKVRAGFGQHQAAGVAVKQARAELFLERDHLAADRRLAEAERTAGAGKAAGLGDREKNPQPVPVHVVLRHRKGQGLARYP